MSWTHPAALGLLVPLLALLAWIGWPRTPHRRRREALALGVRALIALLIVLALADPQVHRAADRLTTVFLLDVSDSVPPAQRSAALDFVRRAADAMRPGDRAALVVFGADALVDLPVTERLEVVQLGADPPRHQTDIAEALRVGLALFPPESARRLVLLSDGQQTIGDAEQVARLAGASDVPIDVVALTPPQAEAQAAPEVMLTRVEAPAIVNEGERFTLTAELVSTYGAEADLRVTAGGHIVAERTVDLPVGTTRESFELSAPAAGFVDFTVTLQPHGADTFYQNNQLAAFTEVQGPPRALLVTDDPREIEALLPALESADLRVDVATAHELPASLAALSSYDAIVLANVSATALTPQRMATLQAYVRDLGGGLVVIGGPQSYGVGGYFQTPLEETLPVEMRIRDPQRIPPMTMLFVIDRSGSMEIASPSGVSNLDIAKEAVLRSIDLLEDSDRVGVLSFDVSAYSVVPIQEVGDTVNRQHLRELVGTLRPGGGTNIYQSMLAADQILRDDPSPIKHIILLTDGGADPGGIVPTVARMYQNGGVTTSVVAVGLAYAAWLENVAEAGNGQFHLAYDVSTIPAIFTAETLLATRSYIVEELFSPVKDAPHPITAPLVSVPPLRGYVATSAKPTATVALRGLYDDPILAAWQYGLGRAVAFTSDASSRWAPNWLAWGGYADFWGRVVHWTVTPDSAENVQTRVTLRGEQATITVEARDTAGDYLNGLQLEAAVVAAGTLQAERVPLRQVAPGRYEGTFTPREQGAYFVTVAGSTPSDAPIPLSVRQTEGWVRGYSDEYRPPTDPVAPRRLLTQIAALSGGRDVTETPARAFAHDLAQRQAAQPLWPALIALAALLWPLDIAVRRVVIRRGIRARLRGRLARRRTTPATPAPEPIRRLQQAKARAHATRQRPPLEETPPSPPPSAPQTEAPPVPPSPPPQQHARSAVEQLLAKKRSRKKPPQ